MWWIVAAAAIVILVAALGMFIGPFLTLKRLPERVEIDGMVLVKDGFVSAALVSLSEHEVAFVDAGNDVQAKALLAELFRRGLSPDDVKVILLTHGHSDHIGGIAKFPKAQVMALGEEADVVEGRSSGGAPIMRFRSPKPTGIRLSRTLHDGEALQLGSFQVRVFAVPGHTPGSAAYAIGENLFLGDSANQDKQGRLRAAPWIFSASAAQNRKSLVELARRLASDTGIKTLVFSHSAPIERGIAPLVEFAARKSTTPQGCPN
jgi:glyoxylase-like metal-dependent hydrolase (beta-lactamase superfamily II)